MPSPSSKIIIGKFGAPFGVHGWIKVNSFTDPVDDILSYKPWYIEEGHDNWVELNITDSKVHAVGVVVQLPDYDDRDEVRVYSNKKIAIEKKQMHKLPKGEYYWEDLFGLAVINQQNEKLGTVEKMLPTGANDVLVVMEGKKERLIPYIKSVILNIDLDKKEILVDWDSDF